MDIQAHPLFPADVPPSTWPLWQRLFLGELKYGYGEYIRGKQHEWNAGDIRKQLFGEIVLGLEIPSSIEIESQIEHERSVIEDGGSKEEMFNWHINMRDVLSQRRHEYQWRKFLQIEALMLTLYREFVLLEKIRSAEAKTLRRCLAILSRPIYVPTLGKNRSGVTVAETAWETFKFDMVDRSIADQLIDECIGFRRFERLPPGSYRYGFTDEEIRFLFERNEYWPWHHVLFEDIKGAIRQMASVYGKIDFPKKHDVKRASLCASASTSIPESRRPTRRRSVP